MLSVVIPAYKEVATIGRLVADLRRSAPPGTGDIQVVDAGSPDGTAQLNYGARQARGDVFYFVRAGVLLQNGRIYTLRCIGTA